MAAAFESSPFILNDRHNGIWTVFRCWQMRQINNRWECVIHPNGIFFLVFLRIFVYFPFGWMLFAWNGVPFRFLILMKHIWILDTFEIATFQLFINSPLIAVPRRSLSQRAAHTHAVGSPEPDVTRDLTHNKMSYAIICRAFLMENARKNGW